MKLTVGNGQVIEKPTADDIARVLAELEVTHGGDSFAILALNEKCFVQCACNEPDEFRMEYRLGSDESHYVSRRDDLSLLTVAKTLQRFATFDPSWQEEIGWIPLAPPEPPPPYVPAPKPRHRLIEIHGRNIVISRKWAMRIGGLGLIALGFLLIGANFRASATVMTSGFVMFFVAHD